MKNEPTGLPDNQKINMFLVRPPGGAITRPLQDVTVAESQTAELECEVANAKAEGKWLKEGKPVDFNENVVSEADGARRRLLIIITRPQDVGEYTYQVANSKTSANLRVEGESSPLSRRTVDDNKLLLLFCPKTFQSQFYHRKQTL